MAHFDGDVKRVFSAGAGYAAFGHGMAMLLALALQFVLTRLLSLEEYGFYVYAFSWLVVVGTLARGGMQTGLVKFVSAYRAQENPAALRGVAIRGVQLTFGFGVVAALLSAWMVGLLGESVPEGQRLTLYAACATLPLFSVLGALTGVLQGCREVFGAVFWNRVWLHVGRLAVVLLVARTLTLGTAYEVMLLTWIVLLWGVLLAGTRVNRHIPVLRRGCISEYRTVDWLKTSTPLLLVGSAALIMKQADVIMLGTILGPEPAGIYFPVARISELAGFGLLIVGNIAMPMLSESFQSGDSTSLRRIVTYSTLVSAVITAVAVLVLCLVGDDILWYLGEDFASGYSALVVLCAGQLMVALVGPVGSIATMMGGERYAALVLLVVCLVNIFLNVVLIPRFGLMGAATATSVSLVLWSVVLWIRVMRKHGVDASLIYPMRRAYLALL